MGLPSPNGNARVEFLVISVAAAILFAVVSSVDLFALLIHWTVLYETVTLDELATGLAFLVLAFSVFSYRRWRELQSEVVARRAVEASLTARTVQLETALAEVKTLRGLVPMCAWCSRRVRGPDGAWVELSTYISEHTEATVTHGICPDCATQMRPRLGGAPRT